jgi:hypothetical protein
MDKKIAELFDNWQNYMQKMNELYTRVGVLLTDLGIASGTVRIITFASSAWRKEIRFCDSSKILQNSPQYIKTNEKLLAKEHLIDLFQTKPEFCIFNFDGRSAHIKSYDEFGLIPQMHDEIWHYGVVIQYPELESSKIIYELLTQLSVYCRNVLDEDKFEIKEYMLANLVHTALKKQIDIDFYNTLAASSYEKRVTFGGILLLDEDIDENRQCDLKIRFEEEYPLDIKNVRQIRKLLEMTADKFYLISKKGNVIGIGDCDADCDLFQFNGHQTWSYHRSGKDLLTYKEGKYTFILSRNRNFISDFPKNFIKTSNAEHLNDILHEIRQQKHGTLLIISDDSQTEVERLCTLKRGYAIEPIDLKLPKNRSLLSNITSIDGALFIDTDFMCYGVGVILDGIAVKTGLSYRGARYNSAKCYIDKKK